MCVLLPQVPHEPTTSIKGPAGCRSAHASLRSHHKLDRTEAQQRVREDSSSTQHGGLYDRHHDTYPGRVPVKLYVQI